MFKEVNTLIIAKAPEQKEQLNVFLIHKTGFFRKRYFLWNFKSNYECLSLTELFFDILKNLENNGYGSCEIIVDDHVDEEVINVAATRAHERLMEVIENAKKDNPPTDTTDKS